MKPAVAKRLRLLASALTVVVLITLLFAWWFYFRLRQSLPQLEGTTALPGLAAPVQVERDGLGVPTLTGTDRRDVARALGFVHAQDRFFQMDLARRRASGELAELIGGALVDADKGARTHGFRRLAEQVVANLPGYQRELLDAYTAGVNEGLTQLRYKPFEYILLRQDPRPWTTEDSVLIIYTMTLDLQDEYGTYEQSLAAVRDVLGNAALAFFAPLVGPADAAMDESNQPLANMPSARAIDLRLRERTSASILLAPPDDTVMYGSNGFALAGGRTSSGAAMLANDMHLALRLPNIWYRAVLKFPGQSGAIERIAGVTLPGTPVVVAGSNGRIAWGFTNANVDVSDVVAIDLSTIDSTLYLTGRDIVPFETREERIHVRGGDPVIHEVRWTRYGPIVGSDSQRRPLALKWTMHDPAAANFDLVDLEAAGSVNDALQIAQRSGIPVQNFVVVDRDGNAGWTIAGKIPRRVGFDGRLPVSWTFGDRRWDGYLQSEQVPVYLAATDGQIWTANQRLFGGEKLRVLGDGGYDRPNRAARIRDLMTPMRNAKPEDLLRVQLDAGAPHLDRWHSLLRSVLTDEVVGKNKDRARLRDAIAKWEARAEVDSVSYRLVRRFRAKVVANTLPAIFQPCIEAYPAFSYRRFNYDPALWQILDSRPGHLLNPRFTSWDDLLVASVDDLLAELKEANVLVEDATWGALNTTRIQHPFAHLTALAEPFLRLTPRPLPGDYDTPRVQAPDDGASERFVVSPGREEEGIFHMPGGQSGHPLSPYFSGGHEAWEEGKAAPFLPGSTRHTLTLTPSVNSGR
jgi:penicillin G amidase